jgi:elongation factor P hydroxylase
MTDPIAARIAQVFNDQFFGSHHTLMCGGGTEPLYEPASGAMPARIVFTNDYPASALHEAAHWCLAGPARRLRRDYGYWYVPGPRDPRQRAAFFAAEADTQAVEAILARSCGVRFVVSADDFAAAPAELESFAQRVAERIEARRLQGLPTRGRRFRDALAAAFEHDRG